MLTKRVFGKLKNMLREKSHSILGQNDADPYEQRERLYQEMLLSKTPHIVNLRLNELERNLRLDKLYSFPTHVVLSMTNICNARCSFCNYTPKPKELREMLTLEDVKKMSWFKYVGTLNLNGGFGDSLVNAQFPDILHYIKNTFQHLAFTITTNGVGLTKQICQSFVDNLTYVLVSINASTKNTWERIMRARGFDHVLAMSSFLAEMKRKRNVSKPQLIVSMVLLKDNIHEAPDFVDLAHKIGADKVIFVNYLLTSLFEKKDLDESHSLYHHQEYCDEVLDKAALRAKELGIELQKPLPFSQKEYYISLGERSNRPPEPCMQPWTNCSLSSLPGEDRYNEMVFCCFGIPYRIYYDKSKLTEEYFVQNIWNHPAARYIRRTINVKEGNPICSFCNTHDRFNPVNLASYNAIYRKTDSFFQEIAKKHALESIKRQEIAPFMRDKDSAI